MSVEPAQPASPAEDVLIPGVPGPVPPALEEPTAPQDPLPPKADQAAPRVQTATGVTKATPTARAQNGAFLTTAGGTRLRDTDHSLKAGPRGPVLLQDHHLREKTSHFDHERIPERVIHARGAAAYGVFEGNGAASSICSSEFLAAGVQTPVFTRFSTVLGSRGSADTVRDTRGFAVKFYTQQGVFDLVGNNMPVFFIQDGIKFADVIHAGKPHPDREIPQAQSAHDTFWDFASLHTEAQHHAMWNMSDRGIPRSYRTMEGFGIHTFRLVDTEGATTMVKFHWKPRLGVHSLTWEEAQLLNGIDPDFHRRDLADSIESGAAPVWDFGIQTFPDTEDQMFEGIDLLDSTKFVPEELAPVQVIGTMTLNANPTNYFAETEQVAFHTAHLVPGIDVSDDPLLAARHFSYLDTQITRLGGPNFEQIPVNRSHAPVNDNLRDGYHQHAVQSGPAAYSPNSLGGGCPFVAGVADGGFVDVPVPVAAAVKVRENPASYDDHYSQVRLFWASMTPTEKEHIVASYTFELSKVYEQTIKERQLLALANIDPVLCSEVADGLGLPVPEPTEALTEETPSAALSQLGGEWPVDGRIVGILVDPQGDLTGLAELRRSISEQSMVPFVISDRGGQLPDGTPVQRTLVTVRSVELDALVVLGVPVTGAHAARDGKVGNDSVLDPRVVLLVEELYRQAKPFAAVAGVEGLLGEARVDLSGPGVVLAADAAGALSPLVELIAHHRVWERFPALL